MEISKLLFALLFCCCLTACQWNLEEIELANAQATCLQNCVNGTCNSNNICECKTGWQGLNCNEEIENPTTNLNFCDTVNCNNGTCNEALDRCDCEDGWSGENCLIPVENEVVTFEKTISLSNFYIEELEVHQIIEVDGGFIISGVNKIGYDKFLLIIKINLVGEIEWVNQYSEGTHETSITKFEDEYFVTFHRSLYKISKNGNIKWKKDFDVYDLIKIKKYNGNSLLLAGSDAKNGSRDMWLSKINIDGNIIWSKSYGGTNGDLATNIHLVNNNLLFLGLSASSNGDLPANNGELDIALINTNLNGNINWSKNFGGSKSDFSYSVISDNNYYYIVGETNSNDYDIESNYGDGYDACIMKVDSNGNLQWFKNYGGSRWECFKTIYPTLDGNFIVAGYTYSSDYDVSINNSPPSFWLVKINKNGDIIWEKTYKSEGGLSDMQITSDGGFIMVGTKEYKEIYIVKTDANGNL